MGISYRFELAIGFEVSMEEVDRVFGHTTDEVCHMEDRYDPRTGERLEPVLVRDQQSERVLMFDGLEVDEWLIGDELAGLLDCDVHRIDPYDGPVLAFVFGPHMKMNEEDALDDYHAGCSGSVYVDDIVTGKFATELKRIEERLHALGFEVGRPKVQIVWSIG